MIRGTMHDIQVWFPNQASKSQEGSKVERHAGVGMTILPQRYGVLES
jgi:hypothetical protein